MSHPEGFDFVGYDIDYVKEAMDFILHELRWVDHFQSSSLNRIRDVCLAVKEERPLPFKHHESKTHKTTQHNES